ARISSSQKVRVNESALTGESEAVGKISDVIDQGKLSVAEQKNMVFKGTHVVAGVAQAVVVGTGVNTYIGQISKQMSVIDTEIPLQANIRFLSKWIIIVVLIISAVIFALGYFGGKSPTEMFTLSVAVLVSAIPEGLPIVMTLLLASGVWRMSKKNVLVKRLQAVEALGEAKIIAVD